MNPVAKPDRVQFQEIVRDAAIGKFELVLFWAFDRFTGERILAALKYLETLGIHKVRWRSLTETWIDSAGPLQDVIITCWRVWRNRKGLGSLKGSGPG